MGINVIKNTKFDFEKGEEIIDSLIRHWNKDIRQTLRVGSASILFSIVSCILYVRDRHWAYIFQLFCGIFFLVVILYANKEQQNKRESTYEKLSIDKDSFGFRKVIGIILDAFHEKQLINEPSGSSSGD